MRIFKTYLFNAAETCKFKDMFDLVDRILQSNNWSYQDLWFNFSGVAPEEVVKITNKIPQLEVYYHTPGFKERHWAISNLNNQWADGNQNNPLPKVNPGLIRKVVNGIPRPFNTPFNLVIFDGINWFGKPAMPMQLKEKGSMHGIYDDIDSSSIAMRKEFDYGNKYNPVTIRIDVTSDISNEILDDTFIVAVFCEKFGKFSKSNMSYAIEEHEKENLDRKNAEATKITEDMESLFWDKKNFVPKKSSILPHQLGWDYSSDTKWDRACLLESPIRLSPKSAILRVFKSSGFRYVNCMNSYYTIEKIDDFNNQILLGIDMAPNCRRMSCRMDYNGLGFVYRMNLCQYTPDDQEGVIKFIENVYTAVKYLEQHYFLKIQQLYGKTPSWYQYEKNNNR